MTGLEQLGIGLGRYVSDNTSTVVLGDNGNSSRSDQIRFKGFMSIPNAQWIYEIWKMTTCMVFKSRDHETADEVCSW